MRRAPRAATGLGADKRTLAVVVASSCLHLSLVGVAAISAPEPPGPPPPPVRAGSGPIVASAKGLARPVVAQAARAALVARARADRARGDLALGEVLLEANAIDAAEEGAPFDLDRSRAAYRERVARLADALSRLPVERAVPAVFADLRYAGMPGGRMGDTLLSGSGSCEPSSQLVASALHDAGLGDRAELRFYGGVTSGASHLAAVVRVGRVERDLLAGRPSARGGRAFPASELVDAWARAHGLAEKVAAVSSAPSRAAPDDGLFGDIPGTRTMTAGYPVNDDAFEGSLPLYASRAVADAEDDAPRREGRGADDDDRSLEHLAESCAVFLRLGELDPPTAQAFPAGDGDPETVSLHLLPSRAQLEHTASNVAELERARAGLSKEPMRRLVALGCLAGLYDRAALQFSFAREPAVSARAVAEARRARKEGSELLASLGLAGDDPGPRKELLRDASVGLWVLLLLDGGDDVVLRVAREAPDDSFVSIQLAAALVVSPGSRVRGVRFAASLPLDTQISVMQELAHAHDNARPWSGTWDPDLETFGDTEEARRFARTYRVLRPVAWKLWEVAASPADTVASLLTDAKRVGLDPERTHAVLAYYVQNALWLYARRDDATRLIGELDRALTDNHQGGLLDFDDVKPYPADARTIRAALDAYARERPR